MIQSNFPAVSKKDIVLLPFSVKCISEAECVFDFVAQEAISAGDTLYWTGYLNTPDKYLRVQNKFTIEARMSSNVAATFVLTANIDLKGKDTGVLSRLYLHGIYVAGEATITDAYEISSRNSNTVLVPKGTKYYIIYDPNSSQSENSRITITDASGTVLKTHNWLNASSNSMILYWF